MNRWMLAVGLMCLCPAAAAEFTGTGELGLVLARGNSDSETGNARLELVYEYERWSNRSEFSAVHSRDDGTTNTSRWVLANQTEYSLSDASYVLGVLRYDRDRFSSFRYQATAAIGYGRRLIDTETHRLKAEIGPGFRFSEIRATGESENEVVVRARLDYEWTISASAMLSNGLLIEAGADNTFAENSLGLTVSINDRVSLKTGVAVRHNTEVEPGRKKTDTLSTVNLVYNFGS